jgi:hypothetical protein
MQCWRQRSRHEILLNEAFVCHVSGRCEPCYCFCVVGRQAGVLLLLLLLCSDAAYGRQGTVIELEGSNGRPMRCADSRDRRNGSAR